MIRPAPRVTRNSPRQAPARRQIEGSAPRPRIATPRKAGNRPGGPRREAEIQREILNYLRRTGIVAFRANAGAMFGEHKGKRWAVRFGEPGQADIQGYIRQEPWPRPFYFEVKRPGGRPTPAQEHFLLQRAADGCLAATVTSVEDVMLVLRNQKP